MSVATTVGVILSFPINLVRWLWNLLKAGELRMRLQAERKQLRVLRDMRDNQLRSLREHGTSLLKLRLDAISMNIAMTKIEPYISVTMTFFNCSMFTIQLKNLKFVARLNGNLLTLASTITSDASRMFPGTQVSLTFNQPIQSQTQESLISAVNRHDRISWDFTVVSDYVIEETGDLGNFRPDSLKRVEIPFVR